MESLVSTGMKTWRLTVGISCKIFSGQLFASRNVFSRERLVICAPFCLMLKPEATVKWTVWSTNMAVYPHILARCPFFLKFGIFIADFHSNNGSDDSYLFAADEALLTSPSRLSPLLPPPVSTCYLGTSVTTTTQHQTVKTRELTYILTSDVTKVLPSRWRLSCQKHGVLRTCDSLGMWKLIFLWTGASH